ncbi:REP-associated tyrosine transposase [Labrys sp. (in: a-proteobacteria)]|uniref:REP-associated tyrosine transposase n=1 Tax=Labrys sp. (in: a-proteobacteria) TaxID=1917972 RepID=UPI0039E53172
MERKYSANNLPMEGGGHRGWYQPHGLPHFDTPEIVQFVTFRLADSLPAWVEDRRETSVEMRRRVESKLDEGMGTCWLANTDIALLVEGALLAFHMQRYRLWSWCIMPNHVHCLFDLKDGWRLADVVKSWKSYTAARANRILGRQGVFWQADYFDRYMRSEDQMARTIDYIERNPVKAGLCTHCTEWRWSSARRKLGGGSSDPASNFITE